MSATGNLVPHGGRPVSPPARRERLEPVASQPLRRGRCDWCGRKTPRGRVYCSSQCRERYNSLVTRQGKALVQSLKLWRLHRGRRGTPGAGKITLISERVDALLAEDRQRWAELQEGDSECGE
ncbi:hypothetical protein LO749_21570 (plasmid) [Paracoccus denitrificans]|uniref:hypothetical protein n=1 Tax=Paracoccus denitrificans TaxID=266 RepID=UPI001E3EE3EA|nr:hypothetical protein [Paracoccus denitrificans]UFS68233.1 hypothetical protein LO749_21570 [Paracoccus denitrificans]